MKMTGRHVCVSYAAPQDLQVCLSIGQSVMLDNGAFSHHTRGLKPDWEAYYRWLDPILGHPHWAVVPDVIDGSVTQQRDLLGRWPFRQDYGIPVWHLGLPLDWLYELADWGRVCFGSAGEY